LRGGARSVAPGGLGQPSSGAERFGPKASRSRRVSRRDRNPGLRRRAGRSDSTGPQTTARIEMSTTAELNFVQQQGFRDASPGDCELTYPALMWQPRLTGLIVLAGLITQDWRIFLGMAVILWWSVAFPRWNPFDALYNRFIAARKGLPP